MATQQDSILGLFTTPEQYQLSRDQQLATNQLELAKLSPEQRAVYNIGQGFRGAVDVGARALGANDPQLQLLSLRNQLAQGKDLTSFEGWSKYTQDLQKAGDLQGAAAAAQRATDLRSKFEERQATRDTQLQIARERIQANIDMARERGATQLQIAQMMQEGRVQLAQIAAALKSEKAATAAAVADDKAATRIGQNTVFDTLIGEGDTLTKTIDANKDSFSLGGRAATAIKSVMNPSAPSVQAVSDVDSYLKKARNAYLLAAKGTQTEGDAQRAWEEFAGRLDFSSAEGAKRSVERIQKELATQKQSNEAYLKSRGIQVQGGSKNTSFNSVEEANKANLPKGTIITIGGRRAVVE
jgi:hypothetical protein